MSKRIDQLPVATDVTGAIVPILQGGVDKQAAANLIAAPIYAANEIPYGDGITPGGVTNSLFIYDANNRNLGTFDGSLGIALTINNSANKFVVEDINGTDRGIFYAGATSGGLGAITGLGIDILNDVYTLGNPATNQLTIKATVANLKTCPAYDDDAAANGGGLVTGDIYQTTGNGAITTAGGLMIKQ